MTIYRLDRNGKLFIARREGVALGAYQDGAHMSIGMGDNDSSLKPGDTITLKQAFERLDKRLPYFEEGLSKLFTKPPTQTQFNALLSCYYNAGKRIAPALVELHNQGASPENMQTAFNRREFATNARGVWMRGLAKRRALEGALYATGKYEADLDILTVWHGDPRNPNTKTEAYKVKPEDLPE